MRKKFKEYIEGKIEEKKALIGTFHHSTQDICNDQDIVLLEGILEDIPNIKL